MLLWRGATTVDRPAFIVNTIVLLKPLEPGEVDAVMAELEDFYGYSFGIAEPQLQHPHALFGTALLDEPRMPMWVGREGDRVVSTAASFVAHGVSNVIDVATLHEARGRGYGAAVTWPAALTDPGMPAVLVASELGAPVYERMGFTTVRPITAWSRTSPEPDARAGE